MTQPRFSFVAPVVLFVTFMQGLDDLLQSPSRPNILSVKGLEDLLVASPEVSVGATANGNRERVFDHETFSGASNSLIDTFVGAGNPSRNDLGSDGDSASDEDADSIESWDIGNPDGAIEDVSFNDAMGLRMAAHSKKMALLAPESFRAAANFTCRYTTAPTFSLN